MDTVPTRRGLLFWRVVLPVGVAALLLSLGVANIALRATWREVEDGVLWSPSGGDVVARDVAKSSPADGAGIEVGDTLLAIDGRAVGSVADVVDAIHRGRRGQRLIYTVLRAGSQEVAHVPLGAVPAGNRLLYYLLASVGIFTLLVGTSVRLRRPVDQATLHFFWLTVAFYGVLTFSFSGRLDTLDRVFYWADAASMLLLPPLLVHFALVFPDRPNAWVRSETGRTLLPLLYLPAFALAGLRVTAITRGEGITLSTAIEWLDRAELAYLALCMAAGLAVLVRALRRVRSVTARRQLRWIVWGTSLGSVPFVFGYALPFAFGMTPPAALELTVLLIGLVPLAFASAIVRYRLMDVEVIIKRGLVYAAAVAAIAAIYATLLRFAGEVFLEGRDEHNTVIALLATLVVVLLAHPVKNMIQTALDRVYYRDRYDYRRALVGFARELNSDLDLQRLSERLVQRVLETLAVDRMALLLAPPEPAARTAHAFGVIASAGFEPDQRPHIARESEIATRLMAGQSVSFEDPFSARRYSPDEVAAWKDCGVHYFVPCVSKEGAIAVMALGRRASGEPLSSEDMALLAAVAGQAATALENARLYRQLRVKAEEVDRMRQFSDSILESLNDGLAVVDLEDRVVRWNTPLEQLFGLARASAVGRTLDTIFEPSFVESLRAARRDAPAGAMLFRVPMTSAHQDGPRRLLVNVAAAPLRTPAGDTAGTIIIVEDITSRVQLEEQLQISEKMASIGLLAAGVAHEVNTPLTGISSYTQMLLDRADPDDPRTKLLEKIERQTFRAAKIVNGLLNLARPAQVETGPVDLHAVINDVLALLDHQFRTAKIQVRKELAPAPPIVEGIEYKLQQVFLNLFLNARDAMPRGGWLSVTTRREAGRAVVEISDTGSGIPAEQLSRIYDPFFTTKALGKGTGLGLSITYGIVQEHGGTITCESAVGQGTRFALMLPLAAGRSEQAAH
ncbi:MAG TPA: ATP-binding protein [Vicinamibacterales bacterium]|nr:ATP-binding protein [Vicinamibacterales bacterium]